MVSRGRFFMLDPVLIRRGLRVRHDWLLRSHLRAAERLAGFLSTIEGTDYKAALDVAAALPRPQVVRHLRKARLEVRAGRFGGFAGVVRHGRLRLLHRLGASPSEAFGPAVSEHALVLRPPLPPNAGVGAKTPENAPPGRAEARAYLVRVTRSTDRAFLAAMARAGAGDDQTETHWTVPPTPDQSINALMILQLARALAHAGQDIFGLRPAAGTIMTITAPQLPDRKRLAALLPEVQSKNTGCIVLHEGDTASRSRSDDLIQKTEAALLAGRGVILILSADTALPGRLRPIVSSRTGLAPFDAAMFATLLGLLHPGSEILSETFGPDLARLNYAHLIPALAARDAATAQARLADALAAMAPGTDATLDAVHGQPEAVAALRQVIVDLADWRARQIAWSDVTRSFLLHGPPGTGKTMLAQALAGSAGVPLVQTSYSECQRHGHQGDMLRELYGAAERAMASAPAVFFLDEIDGFYSRDRSQTGYIIGVVNGLLTLIDRLLATPGVILIAATNDLERVDPAVIRAGRFDRHIRVGLPDRAGIRAMLCAGLPAALADAAVDELADQLLGLSGAEMAALLRDARTRARAARRELSLADLTEAADAAQPRPDPALLWRIAVHEAGHLLASHILGLEPPTGVRIFGRGGCVTRPNPALHTQTSIPAHLQLLLAGRVAEALLFNAVSHGGGAGPDSDLAQATQLAMAAEAQFGFGPLLAWHRQDQPLTHLPLDVRGRVEARLKQAQSDVTALLAAYQPDLQRVAEELLAARELGAADLARLLEPVAQGGPEPTADLQVEA
jgi:cell division protease FtsH